jgi:hypothetical protein
LGARTEEDVTKSRLTATIVITTPIAVACGAATDASDAQTVQNTDRSASSGEVTGTTAQPSWAYSFNTVSELKAGSDLGAVLTIVAVSDSTAETPGQKLVTADVDHIVWQADDASVPEAIQFTLTVGADGEPPTTYGDRWVIFFQRYETNKYRTMGPTGWFEISASGAVTPIPGNAVRLKRETKAPYFRHRILHHD